MKTGGLEILVTKKISKKNVVQSSDDLIDKITTDLFRKTNFKILVSDRF